MTKRKRILSTAIMAITAMLLVAGMPMFAQESLLLPDAPTPHTTDGMHPLSIGRVSIPFPSGPRHIESNREKWAYRSSVWALAATSVFDDVETYRNITHPLHVSYTVCYCSLATLTPAECAALPWGQSFNYEVITVPAHYFSEGGWPKIFGARNVPAILIAGPALDVVIWRIDRALYRKGGKWRVIAIGINAWKAGGHIEGAMSNISSIPRSEHYFIPTGAYDVHWH